MIFNTERELPPIYGLSWKPHPRVRVRYDNTHPVAGSHHQEVVARRVLWRSRSDLTSAGTPAIISRAMRDARRMTFRTRRFMT
jgi:hypothetical protein